MRNQLVLPLLRRAQSENFTVTTLVALILLLFICLVASGLTGSSIGLGLDHQQEIIQSDSKLIFRQYRDIRSDEWIVLTPMAIAQTQHTPKFPIINKRLGPDGQNMLITGMTGIPVAHISSLSKPAVWGYFLFDLRRGLSWSWWFPVFGCLLALWWMMSILNAGKPIINLLTSVAFVTSGYSVAWSNWPAYAVFFPAVSFCFVFSILYGGTPRWLKFLYSALLGVALPGFLFVLYPAWQVPLAYLFGFVFLAVILEKQLWRGFNYYTVACLVLAVALAGIIIYCWWVDAKSAIEAIQATIYPGQRSSVSGGGYESWRFFRGFLNNYSGFYEGSPLTNASESASFFYFFPVLLACFVFNGLKGIRVTIVEAALLFFCILVCFYQFIGFYPLLAEFSLWGRSVPSRADIALGLASIIVCSLWLSRADGRGVPSNFIASVFAVFYSAIVVLSLNAYPVTVFGDIPITILLVGAPLVYLLGYWLLTRQCVKFFSMLVFWNLSIYVLFNPIAVAPSQVVSRFPALDSDDRVIYVGGAHAMTLFAAGVPIYNGVFYYPQAGIWETFDPGSDKLDITNRYQRLAFELEEVNEDGYHRISSPHPDVVKISVDPLKFDFSTTGAAFVLGVVDSDLRQNKSLKLIEDLGRNGIFKIAD